MNWQKAALFLRQMKICCVIQWAGRSELGSFVAFLWEIWKASPVICTVGSRVQLFLGAAIPDCQ